VRLSLRIETFDDFLAVVEDLALLTLVKQGPQFQIP
jgi:hypothetical protein